MNESPEAPPALPQSQVLSYLTTISTPTRVRRVTHVGLDLAGCMNMLTATAIFVVIVVSYVDRYGVDLWNAPSNLMREYKFALFLLTVVLTCASAQFFLGKPVEAGSARACRWLVPTIFPNAAVFFVGALVAAGKGFEFFDANGHGSTARALVGILCGTVFLACAVGIVLISDLSKFLQWIAQQPAAEKPPTPFLSGINQ